MSCPDTLTGTKAGRLPAILALLAFAFAAEAGPFADPGDLRLRHDLQRLEQAGVINVPITTWPLSWGDLSAALDSVDEQGLDLVERAAWQRLRRTARRELDSRATRVTASASAAANPRIIRSFEDTPRETGQASAGIVRAGDRTAFELRLTVAPDPDDGEELRADGSYFGLALGNWALAAGWQERWWGPGRDGGLILSSNARPIPALALTRIRSTAFESRWLSWIGPWTLAAFVGQLDDERAVDGALLVGLRGVFRPLPSLEIGLSRTAQWCGDDRPCGISAFADLLLGRDNRGVNVQPGDEPGNQLAGIDLRFAPRRLPGALYAQWIGEDSRRGGPEIGSWLRLAGIELQGSFGGMAHRSHLEVSETSCRQGGLGFSELVANCAYENSIYRSGYRYRGRSLGHGMDGDGLSFSFGSTLVQSAGHAWSVVLRRMDINRAGPASARHSLSPLPQDRLDVQLSHQRTLAVGILHAGLGYRRIEDSVSGERSNDVTGFIQWSMQ